MIGPGEVSREHLEDAKRRVDNIDYFLFSHELNEAPKVMQKLLPDCGEWPPAPTRPQNKHNYVVDKVPVDEAWFRKHNVLDMELFDYILNVSAQRTASLAAHS